ncbi:anti-Muellerian hormone type-2 receptor [Bombina bombina]|uniref:anti-Muellerian hormone type-2 receptor n=1 Tax=Bombina bombina TaxID=8345 RepID=UPI00235A5D6F|nr:anti-Muellerian hormone type-2 receptor [Bombina bombina]
MSNWQLYSTVLLTYAMLLPVADHEGIVCALYKNSSYNVSVPISDKWELEGPGKIRCRDSNCCMALWSREAGTTQTVILSCYPKNAVCRSELCIPVESKSPYCLCSTDMCNANISLPLQASAPAQVEMKRCAHWNLSCDWSEAARERERNASRFSGHLAAYVAMATFFLLLGVTVIIIVVRRKKLCGLHVTSEELHQLQEVLTEPHNPPLQPVEGLTLLQVVREEELAANVWLGSLQGREVIIKCFPPSLKELYRQEWRILSLMTPLQHENIACLLAAGSGSAGILKHHQLLVLKHYPEGCLRFYLTSHTTDWPRACRMATTLARGLAFLHTYMWREDKYKPAIAHRDLSSDNILVTTDGSCVISDFGLSVVLMENQLKSKKSQDTAVISMNGTLRYMSPEMLDGSLNLMSWETALAQADVYSLGLLLWEIFTRCKSLYEDLQAPEFQVVFLEELGTNVTLDGLRTLVVENKCRPRFPRTWCGNQLSLVLWETLEDCWDPDCEARLTAQCAEQRLTNLCLFHCNVLQEEPALCTAPHHIPTD